MDTKTRNEFFETQVLGHPAGLMVLFFTEMWERFSFYGMRVLLINFLTMATISYNPGWEWSAENAGALYGTYAGLLYLTPILGGLIADKYIGYRWAVVVGSIIMTLGHASMALETEFSLYMGLALLVIGTGFFKPNMTSIVSEMYKDLPEKKDGAYTIFYMGVNAGAFFGMMLCGYLAERIGWSWGFGLAGIFMLFGTLQFWLAKPLFGDIGEIPSKLKAKAEAEALENPKTEEEIEEDSEAEVEGEEKRNPFTLVDKILVAITAIIGFGYLINDPMSKIGGINMFEFLDTTKLAGQYVAVIFGLILFLYLVGSRIMRYDRIVRDRMIAFIIFAFFTVFFWMSFEQGASSLVIFARDDVNRSLSGGYATMFNIVNIMLTVIPLLIITYVLFLLWKQTFKKIPGSNIVLVVCFAIVWGIVGWMINRDLSSSAYMVSYQAMETTKFNKKTEKIDTTYTPITKAYLVSNPGVIADTVMLIKITEPVTLTLDQEISIIKKNNEGTDFGYLGEEKIEKFKNHAAQLDKDNGIVPAKVAVIKNNEVEITVSWFSILNSFFIIAFAPLFSKWWDSKYNPSVAVKYALGLIIMAAGFGFLAMGAYGVGAGIKVSMIWLIIAYLFHTLGELCLSPVGLSYVSKLVPARMIAFMFGMWYLAIAIGNKLAAVLGGQIENITESYSLSTFFLIFTIVPAVAGVLILLLAPLLKKLMHGIK